MRDGALERSDTEAKDPRAELGQHLRGLFDSCGFSLRQFTQKHGFSHSAIARYLSGERLPRKAFLDALLNERGNDDVAPVTEDVRQLTFSLYRAALEASGSGILLELYQLEVRLEDLMAELDQVHAHAHDLEKLRARGESEARASEQDLEGEVAALMHQRAGILAELDRVRYEISRRENTLAAQDHSPSARVRFSPPPGGTPPLPPASPTVPSGGQRSGPGNRALWAVSGIAVIAAAVFFGMWLGKFSQQPETPTDSSRPGLSEGSRDPAPDSSRSTPARPKNGDEPQAIVSTTAVIPRGEALDADSDRPILWGTEYEWGDFQVSDNPVQASAFTGNQYASLALSKAADWNTCGLAQGFENQAVPAASLHTGTTLCGITGEGNRCALTIETVQADSRGVRSVTIRYTTWDTTSSVN